MRVAWAPLEAEKNENEAWIDFMPYVRISLTFHKMEENHIKLVNLAH